MIRFAQRKDKEELLELCISSHPMKEKAFLDYYFSYIFTDGSALLCELDNHLVSQIHKQEHVLHFQGKLLSVSYLLAVATHHDYRRRGIMQDLMEKSLDDCRRNHLLTFIEAVNPKLYEKFGFETIAYRNRYIVYATELVKYRVDGVEEKADVKGMSDVYQRFAQRFDCYYDRDETYYKKLLQRIEVEGLKVCMYQNTDGIVDGYAIYSELDDGIEVKEVIYMDSKSLCHMLRYAIGYNPFISIEVSEAERLDKIFKLSVPRSHASVMVRINDVKLYNKLFNCNVKSSKDIKNQLKKPILINEKW